MRTLKILLIYFFVVLILLAVLPLIFVTISSSAQGSNNSQIKADSLVVAVISPQGEKTKLPIEEYLVGVVAAEMPASFESEALKAQAIAARTFVYRNIPVPLQENGTDEEDIAVSSDPARFQAYIDERERSQRWHSNKEKNEAKIRQVIQETQGIIITKDGKAVTTPYSAICGGQTASSADVWGGDNSWLQSVPCKWDKEAAKYESEVTLTLEEVSQKLSAEIKDVKKMKVISRYKDNRIKQMAIGEKTWNGTEIRNVLGLNSTNFTWDIKGDDIFFHVQGYGHGVGLCQYGANGLAKKGYTAEKILKYYYNGIELTKAY
ncbi:MAG: stage II sporulation protein D [Bacillota bacterium]|jgi:stage II sporulation protein D